MINEDYTHPNDYIDTVKTKDQYGQIIHAVPKTMEQEYEEFKQFFNTASHEAQTLIIQAIVRNYPNDVKEFLKEL